MNPDEVVDEVVDRHGASCRAEIPLKPVFPNAFYGSLVDLIKSSGAAGRQGIGFTVNLTSVRSLRFERIR